MYSMSRSMLQIGSIRLASRLVATCRGVLRQQAYSGRSGRNTDVRTIDLRSDVLSKPTPEMMRAMVENACYGDDVMSENTTVMKLEARVASMLGKEAGLFVATGTMGNILPLMSHCRVRGSEVILGDLSHIHLYEQGGLASIAGIHHRTAITQPDGTLCLKQCDGLVRVWPDDPHFPATRALCLENTQCVSGGKVLPVEYFAKAREFCDKHGIKLHLDGARLLNATIASNVEPIEYTRYVDSVTTSFSKCLGAPDGSCIAGDAEMIKYCRRIRKSIGGAARQPGMLAAAANHALDTASVSVSADHANAQVIYSGVSRLKLPNWLVFDKPDTNIMLLNITNEAPMSINKLKKIIEEPNPDCPIRLRTPFISPVTIRMLTHNSLSREDCELVVEKFASVLPLLH